MKQKSGLTVLELLVCLSILSVLLATAMPDFKNSMQAISGDITLRRLATAVQFGKMAAITNSTSVTLCRSLNGSECGGRWQDGVLIFTDKNRDRIIDGNDILLRHITFPYGRGDIRFRAFQNKQYLQLSSLGITHYQNGNFTYCPVSGDTSLARQLIVNRAARLRFAQDADGDGINEDSRGRPLRCN